jgi:DNA (cytosine-5)-methyltransferase 1|uniref:DNA (cytosine-5-)-methyltransferase n=1 Tax=Siphoviridae sp. ctss15 TaxID=2825699 RepID=A0A8S5TR77_9CAUD|nr:MAG TPA: Cytosine specific methyltransferase [Siphoviridae sp. ctss15]
MKHLGDITKINGAEIEAVDVITGGSPCQDLSIAGKRAGLAGARSGLFMEQIRIVKEMREHDRANGRTGDMVRPRFMVWENVPGAFSSNGGQDFAAVLEEIIRIAEPEAPNIEVPEKGWNTWGGYHDEVGGRWSVAWRVHDAQHWGVAQRRRRISIVADFGGDTAGEILFERKSVSGYLTESGTARERLAADAESSSSYAVRIRGGCDGGGKGALVQEDKSGTLGTGNDQTIFCLQGNGIDRADTAGCNGKGWREDTSYTLNTIDRPAVCAYSFDSLSSNSMKSKNPHSGCREVEIAKTLDTTYPDPSKNQGGIAVVALDMTHACDVIRECGEVVPSLQARMGTGGNQVPLTYQQTTGTLSPGAHAGSYNGQDAYNDMLVVSSEISPTLRARASDPCREDMAAYIASVDCRNFCEGGETNGTLQAKSSGGASYNLQNTVRTGMIVRRLTPMECERLQGFPDHWTDIGEWRDSKGKLRKPSDSPRYKALGNSIALPFWDFLAKRISAQYLRPVTMGSLFDGIGGFPLVFERHNGKGTARWASEIEEFPIAVTKLRFGEE